MRDVPTVSVVITNHDYARFLPAAIDSALGQEHANTEVVVVDDGSTDESRGLIASYGDRIRPVLKPNGGQGSAVNAGFAASRGEIVIFLDADDLLLPTAAAEAVHLLAGDDTVKGHWPLLEVDEDGRQTGGVVPVGPLADGDLRELLSSSPSHVTPPQSGNAWSRSFLTRALPMPEAPYRTGADTWLFVLAAGFGRVLRSAEPHGQYRRHAHQDGVSRAFEDQVDVWLRWHEPAWAALAVHCHRRGLPADVDAWRRNSWPGRLRAISAVLDRVIPADDAFVLIDEGHWAMRPDGRRRPLPCRAPSDDATAIAELEELRRRGARFLVVAAEASWWLDSYPEWRDHVMSNYREAFAEDGLLIFELQGPAA